MLTTWAPNNHRWCSLVLLPFLCSLGTLNHAAEFTFSIVDSTTQQPVAARVYVENVDTGTRHFVRALSPTAAVIYERQNWANKNSIEHHTSLPAAPFIAEKLQAGTYQLTVERGKEYFTETRRIVLTEGESRPSETIELRRWVNMAALGWFSGETHLHRPLSELPIVMQAEDLNVAMPLTYWVTQAFTAPSQGNKNQSGEIPDQLIELDPTHVIWPRNTEYEIFTVGEHQHTLGALFVLNHHSILSQGAPDWKPIAEQAKAEGALMDMDKLDWPFAMTLPYTTGATLYELANNHMWRTEFGLTHWNTAAPAFLQPPDGGMDGNEFDWLAYTLGQYYTLLNTGFPLVPTAGTASGVHPVPAGFSRVYVNLDGPFSYNKWIEGLAAGHSFVTTGPMMFAEVNGEQAGATLTDDRVSVSAKIVSEHPLATIEVVVNGQVVETLTPQNELTPKGARQSQVAAETPIESSGWICLRCTEDRPDKRLRFAHTAPWRLDIPGKPLRPSQQEKDYLIQRVQQEIVRSTGILPESAIAEYRAALRHFESLPAVEPNRDDTTSNVETITPDFTALVATDAGLWPQILSADDGTLLAFGYNAPAHTTLPADIECWASRDGGKSWNDLEKLADDINESVLLPLANKSWLCVGRTSNKPAPEHGQELRQFRSTDDGMTWNDEGLVAGYHLHPPHLLRLTDGRILLTYGNRRDATIEVRFSSDDGHAWSNPLTLFSTGRGDMGYPSTAQLPDGHLVTAFYAQRSVLHDGYHMGAIGWKR